jgi:hypothetical protein
MKINVHILIESFDDGDFDVSNTYYKSDEEYFSKMRAEEQMYSNVAYDVVNNLGSNSKGKTASFQLKNIYENDNAKYFSCPAEIYDADHNDETVDNIITYCVNNDVVINIIAFNMEEMCDEFYENIRFWESDHVEINKHINELGEDKVWKNEPLRNLKIEFVNKANETKFANLINCRILEINNNEFTILSERFELS